jgi:hypothetical protein
MVAARSSETSVLTRPTLRKIREDGILRSDYCENLKSHIIIIIVIIIIIYLSVFVYFPLVLTL